ncbi:hypothetical protein DSTSK_36850 [Desulforhabdus sp. TSK]|nr:hypothetical protein DSTSK_36850 [Desulforhabdus sp. TSK]
MLKHSVKVKTRIYSNDYCPHGYELPAGDYRQGNGSA